jgi:hypothetical protein
MRDPMVVPRGQLGYDERAVRWEGSHVISPQNSAFSIQEL